MKRHRLPSLRVPPELQAVADQLRTLGSYFAPLATLLKSLQPQLRALLEFQPVAEEMERRAASYDRRQFGRYKVEFGDWKSLLLAKATALLRRQRKKKKTKEKAPRLEMPPELDSLTQEQYREIVRLFDGGWLDYLAASIELWPALLAHGRRPKDRVSPQEVRALGARKVSLAQKSLQLAKRDKAKARRLRYAERKSRAHKKVER